jgi:hypothetical protein
MHIIFGAAAAEQASSKYTVLELDRLRIEPLGPVIDTYCVIENVPLQELPHLDNYRNLHTKLMENYRRKDWYFCEQALEHLHGRWGGTMNSFYDEISQRVAKYKQQDPGEDWDGVYEKSLVDSGC